MQKNIKYKVTISRKFDWNNNVWNSNIKLLLNDNRSQEEKNNICKFDTKQIIINKCLKCKVINANSNKCKNNYKQKLVGGKCLMKSYKNANCGIL